MFPKIGVPQNGWFIMENQMDDLGVFPHIFGNIQIVSYKKRITNVTPHGYEQMQSLEVPEEEAPKQCGNFASAFT